MEWLRVELTQHITGRTIVNLHLTRFHSVSDKEVPYVDVPGSLTAGCSSILFWQYHTLNILIEDDCVVDLVVLGFQEVLCPGHPLWHYVINPDELSFHHETLCVQLLSPGRKSNIRPPFPIASKSCICTQGSEFKLSLIHW
jgi:hypothetical protein